MRIALCLAGVGLVLTAPVAHAAGTAEMKTQAYEGYKGSGGITATLIVRPGAREANVVGVRRAGLSVTISDQRGLAPGPGCSGPQPTTEVSCALPAGANLDLELDLGLGDGDDSAFVDGFFNGARVDLGPGDDVASAGSTAVRFFGGPGNDVLRGGTDRDTLDGGPGDDLLSG